MASSLPSPDARRRLLAAGPVALLVALAYGPALATAPGVVAADTKQYLYLDPGSFIARARSLWDPSQFGGYVTHQQAGYLWPMGPWFWLTHALGLPEWVAQRLWVGTLVLAAALGARALARRLGLGPGPAFVAALAYGFSPYLLSYVSRTSVLLLPWAALGWVMVLTMRAVERGGWPAPAAIGLVVATVGGVNATAVLLVALGPLVWLLDAVAARRVSWRVAAGAAGRIAVCCLATSLWWVVALVVEGRFGADVLRYSETIRAVSATSSAPEVLRGLGYWLFYGSLVDGRWNSASTAYLADPALLLLGTVLAAVGIAGLVLTRWRPRRWLVAQLLVGVVVAVAAHPPADASPYGRVLAGPLARSTIVLALRSSTRAVPLVVLSLSLGLGAAVAAIGHRRPARARPLVAGAAVATLLNLPALVTGGYVDALLRRPAVPTWWRQAGAELDRRGGGRVLELPGQEFAAYRWGTTTDPILPGLADRALLTRDLLPLGDDQRMNLLYALDQRFQDGTIEPASIAPLARLLGATDVVARLDANWERYRTPAPAAAWAALAAAPGLGAPVVYGPVPVADAVHPVLDPGAAGAAAVPGSVGLFAVDRVPTAPQVAPATGHTLLVGDGDGVVDAAAAGLLDGTTPLAYSADLTDDTSRTAAVAAADSIVITDTNRSAARQWRGTQDVVGYTEDGSVTGFPKDEADARPQPFGATAPAGDQTLAVQESGTGLRATASAYGEPNAYRPEDRAYSAVDGDATTAWVVGDRADPVGARLRLTLPAARPVATLRLVQRQAQTNRSITRVIVRTDHQRLDVALDDASRTSAGQTISLDGTPTASVAIAVAATDVPDPPSFFGLDAVGFAEVTLGLPEAAPPVEEVVHPPTDLTAALSATNTPADISVVLTRQRTDPTNRWRSDPETGLVRRIDLPRAGTVRAAVTARLDRRAGDDVLASLLGLSAAPSASSSLTGVLSARPWSAIDGDGTTAWTSALGDVVGAWWETPLAAGSAVGSVGLRLVDDDRHSRPTAVRVQVGDATAELALPVPGADGSVHVVLPTPLVGDRMRITVTGADVRTTVDRRFGEDVELPVALAEVTAGGTGPDRSAVARIGVPTTFDTGCRTDLLTVDGVAVGLRVHGASAVAAAGGAVAAERCATGAGDPLAASAAGSHLVRSTAGGATGIDIDRVVLTSPGTRSADAAELAAGASVRTARVRAGHGPTGYDVTIGAGDHDGWLTLGDAANAGWTATLDGRSLGPVHHLDGGAAAWLVPAGPGGVVHVRWWPQRWADLAQLVSLLAMLASLGVVVLGGRRRITASAAASAPGAAVAAPTLVSAPASCDAVPASMPTWRRAVPAIGAGLVAAAVIHPVYGGVVLVAVGLVSRGPRRRSRLLLALAGPLLVLVAGAYVVVRQVVSRPVPGFGWPLAMEGAHRPVLLAVLLAAVAVLLDVRAGED